MNRKKILRIITRLNVGGPAQQAILLTKEFNNKNFETLLITGKVDAQEGEMLEYAKQHNVSFKKIYNLKRNISIIDDFKAFIEILKIIFSYKPDIIHTHTSKAGLLGRAAGILTNTKVIIHTFHGNVFEGYFSEFMTNIIILIEKLLAKFSTRLIAISRKQKQELIDRKISDRNKIDTVLLGLELDKFFNNKLTDKELRQEFNIKEKYIIGMVGRLVEIKRHYFFLEIAKEILKKESDIKFILIGDGHLRKPIEEKIKNQGLEDKIIITGNRFDLEKFYAGFTISVLTSYNEGTPVALIESLANKVPVAASRVGGVEDVVIDNVTGFCIDRDDKKAFADKILLLLKDENLRTEFGQKGQIWIKSKYTYQRLVSDLEKIYINALK